MDKSSNPTRPGVEPVGRSRGVHRSLFDDPKWAEIPIEKIKQADLPNLTAIFDELCRRLWGMTPYPDRKLAGVHRCADGGCLKVTCRRLAEYAEQELGDGTALLQVSGVLPVEPTAEEWDAAWACVRRLEMRTRQLSKSATALEVPTTGNDHRPAFGRDQQFLVWNDEGLGAASIRDKWNALPDAERRRICPRCWRTISGGNSGRAVVVTALKKAKKERKI